MSKQSELRVELNKYLARFPEKRLTSFNCTECKVDIQTLKPEIGDEPYSSAVQCPDCFAHMFKVVHDTGAIKVTPIQLQG